MSEQQAGERIHGRSVMVYAYGTDVEALEMAALDEARKFFGPEIQLEVVRDYAVGTYTKNEPGRRYVAGVTVREVVG
jgi:hypothetical protein